jgi:predicted nucleic acid-binding protein
VRKLAALLSAHEDLFLTGSILQEILQAFRADATFRKVASRLEPFPLLELEGSDYLAAARLHRKCAGRGVAVSTIDCQIAVAAIRHDCHLLTTDRDFQRIAEHSRLRLL